MSTATIDVGIMKHRMSVIYQELSEMRNQIEVMEISGNKDAHAYERLNILGEKIMKKTGAVSTKDVIDDVGG